SEHGFTIIQTYGLTVTVGDGGWNSAQDPAHLASVGLRDPDMEYRLEDGELCMKGEAVMLGYYNDPAATAAVLKDGWFHTGDLARIDEDGYIYLTGRKNNLMILPSGENVSPEELETLLGKIPAVREVLVRQKGDKICARICCLPAAQTRSGRSSKQPTAPSPCISGSRRWNLPINRCRATRWARSRGTDRPLVPSCPRPGGAASARRKGTLWLRSRSLFRPFTSWSSGWRATMPTASPSATTTRPWKGCGRSPTGSTPTTSAARRRRCRPPSPTSRASGSACWPPTATTTPSAFLPPSSPEPCWSPSTCKRA